MWRKKSIFSLFLFPKKAASLIIIVERTSNDRLTGVRDDITINARTSRAKRISDRL